MLKSVPVSALRRIPPSMQHAVLHRGEWTLCAMEHSLMDAVHLTDPGAPFHHIGLATGNVPVRTGMDGDGRRIATHFARGDVASIEAGFGGDSWWDSPFESACLYFTNEALAVALGQDVDDRTHHIRTTLAFRSPNVRRLLETLYADAAQGQPHGALVGDAVFTALAAQLAGHETEWRAQAKPSMPDWRVRRALEYIHAHLTSALTIPTIAKASGTSPFHLSRQFRGVLGLSIWQYILRERARFAFALMQSSRQTLTEVSAAAGFETYASFIESIRREFGVVPSRLHQARSRGVGSRGA